LTLVLVLVSCGGVSEASSHRAPSAEDLAQFDADRRQIEIDRRELVLPAPKDFRPESGASSVRLVLLFEKVRLRPGEPMRYRLELVNGDAVPYVFNELSPSFFKTGRLPCDRVLLISRDQKGRDTDLYSPLKTGVDMVHEEVRFPKDWSEKQKDLWLHAKNTAAQAESKLYVKLGPGERLRTRGDAPEDQYRTLRVRQKFDVPGVYFIRAELDTLLGKPGVVSDPVRIEITR